MIYGLFILAVVLTPMWPAEPSDKGGAAQPLKQSQTASHQEQSSSRLETPDQPTAEDLLRALQRERPQNTIISPASLTGLKSHPTQDDGLLLPEGSSLVNRSGRLEREEGWWTFVPDQGGTTAPLRLLPNTTLEVMARTSTTQPEPVRFVVSGEITVFENKNFLLIRAGMRAGGTPSLNGQHGNDATVPSQGQPTDASPEDIIEVLRRQSPEQSAIRIDPLYLGSDLDRANGHLGMLKPEGAQIAGRPGRLERDGQWWSFISESDGRGYREPAYRLLPCRNTELMAAAHQADPSGLVFVVSGETTLFNGENYLLPRVAVRRVVSDNLRK